MRAILTVALIAGVSGAALAQTPAVPPAVKPKAVRTLSVKPDGSTAPAATPVRPALQAPAAGGPNLAERIALQSDLAWTGAYNGAINGDINDRTVNAIKSWQKDNNGKPTGVLTPQERGALAAAAKTLQDHVGWKIGLDPVNGIKLGLPTKLAPVQTAGSTGTRWTSAQGQIQIETWRAKDTNLTIAAIAEREKKEPAGRQVSYSVVKPDFFVLSGLQGLKKFYVRGQIKGNEVRGLTVLYDQATEGSMDPVVVAMSSAFAPFGGDTAQAPAPPPRKKVEYATALVVGADGTLLTDRAAVEGCDVMVIPGLGPAEKLREDAAHNLALLRVYGAGELTPVSFAATPSRNDVTVTGIADPQSQGGGAAVTAMAAHLVSGGGDVKIDPAPGLGFSGAAVSGADGRLAGIALLHAPLVAGPAPAPIEASLVSAEVVRGFLAGAKVAPAKDAALTKASVLRVICVRK
jgi:peptidoglycan hydrolase-like protein with peptidoglycan-binding domain